MSTEIATDLEQRVAENINDARADAGLPALKVEVHLNASAQSHADWMGETGSLSHTGEDGSTPTERIDDTGFPLDGAWRTAENVAWTSVTGDLDSEEVDRMHEGLMESAGHRENILDPEVSYVGVGLSVGMRIVGGEEQEVVYLTQNFAETDGEVLVQEEQGAETVVQPYQDGDPVGEAQPVEPPASDDPDTGSDAAADASRDRNDEEDTSASSGGGCFVATAAYGSWTHPDVVALRRFRDEVLVRYPAGRAFIRAYRKAGPRLARLVSPKGTSGRVARALLAPAARLAARWSDRG